MSRLRIAFGVCAGALLASAFACSDDDGRPPPPATGVTTSSSSSAGGGEGGAGAEGGGGGSVGQGGSAGQGGTAGEGGGGGGPENCFDGVDNDGDQLVDCEDTDDCQASCLDSCGNAVMLADPSLLVQGDTSGHANELIGSCVPPSGREVVYQVTAVETGMLDVAVQSDSADLAVSVRTTCSDDGSELECINRIAMGREILKTPVTAGQTVFVVVEGVDANEAGGYFLDVSSRTISCGDGFTDQPGEECDDGANAPNDGCSATCQVESTESEPANNTAAGADAWAQPYYGTISPAQDVDVVSFDVPAGGNLQAQIFDLGDGGCAGNLLDSYLEILDTDGNTVLAFNDDGVNNFCSAVFISPLAGGTYYVRVSPGSKANPATFAYRLELSMLP